MLHFDRYTWLAIAALALAAPLSTSPSLAADNLPVIATENGSVRGIATDSMFVFRGIPYAAPPVGNLRWRAPQPAKPWRSIRDASRFAGHCAQPLSVFGRATMNEDCLYLNVYVPRPNDVFDPFPLLKPVMIWFHGGALFLGESDDDGFIPNIDNNVLTQTVLDALTNGSFNQVPLLEGSNHDEWRLFVGLTEAATGVPLSAQGYSAAIAATLGISPDQTGLVASRYPLAAYSSPSVALGAIGTDALFACNSRLSAGLASGFVPTFVYEFNDPNAPQRFLSSPSFPTGAYHQGEVQYVFDVDSVLPPDSPGQPRCTRTPSGRGCMRECADARGSIEAVGREWGRDLGKAPVYWRFSCSE